MRYPSHHSARSRPTVVHLTSVHTAHDVRIFQKECCSLVEAGYKVTLVAGNCEPETACGVHVVSVSLPRNRVGRATIGAARVFEAAVRCHGAIYHFHDPELLPVGILLRLLGKHVIFDVHEDPHDDILEKDYLPAWIRGLIARLLLHFCTWSARYFSVVVAATPGIRDRFNQVKCDTQLIYNYPRQEPPTEARKARHPDGGHQFAYIGSIQEGRGIREMVEAINLLPPPCNATLRLAGQFYPEALHSEVSQMPGWSHVRHERWLNREEVQNCLESSCAGIHVPHPLKTFLSCYPNKLFEYMAAGVPVIVSDFRHWRELVEREHCGLCVDPLDPRAIAGAMEFILDHPEEAHEMGLRGRRAVERHYNWSAEARKLVAIYGRLLARSDQQPPVLHNQELS